MFRLLRSLRAVLAMVVLRPSAIAFARFPNRPLALVVPWGACRGSGAVARFIANRWLTKLDPANYTPIALVNFDATGFHLRAGY
jgi:tripartite-type tricarboxylate transporter receptor subunit TctC